MCFRCNAGSLQGQDPPQRALSRLWTCNAAGKNVKELSLNLFHRTSRVQLPTTTWGKRNHAPGSCVQGAGIHRSHWRLERIAYGCLGVQCSKKYNLKQALAWFRSSGAVTFLFRIWLSKLRSIVLYTQETECLCGQAWRAANTVRSTPHNRMHRFDRTSGTSAKQTKRWVQLTIDRSLAYGGDGCTP